VCYRNGILLSFYLDDEKSDSFGHEHEDNNELSAFNLRLCIHWKEKKWNTNFSFW
jgi:hypothetical protein